MNEWEFPKTTVTYEFPEFTDITLTPPTTILENKPVPYPNYCSLENIEGIINGKSNNAVIKFDNGYTMTFDLEIARSIVEEDIKAENQVIFSNSMTYLDNLRNSVFGFGGVSQILGILGTARDYFDYIFKLEQDKTFAWTLIHQRYLRKYPDQNTFTGLAEFAKNMHNEKALVAKVMRDKISGGIGVAGDILGMRTFALNTKNITEKVTQDWNKWQNLIELAKTICEENKRDYYIQQILELQKQNRRHIAGIATGSVAFDGISTFSGKLRMHPIAAFGVGQACALLSEVFNNAYERSNGNFEDKRHELLMQIINDTQCNKKPNKNNDDREPPYPRDPIDPIRDPSGFVYEGVLTMPLEGVNATLYYNPTTEGDGTVWNAKEYSQTNPQITDALGKYGWDVPRGNWRVVFEKEGYETAMTDWLPVPPPQLDVNIGMRKIAPAILKEAHAYEDELTVEMDTYMDGSTLTADGTIYLIVDGQRVDDVAVEFVNGEGSEPVLASKLRIVPAQPFTSESVTLHIGRTASTYCGVQLDSDIEINLPIEPKLRSLDAPAKFEIAYGETAYVKVKALPGTVAKGRTLKVDSSTSTLLGLDKPTATFDADGYAIVEIAGLLPGKAVLIFSVDGYDLAATTVVTIGHSTSADVASPVASIPSGSEVITGTELTLTCDTPDAVIYYTLDGSCPCDPASTRQVYSVPIEITNNVRIKAIAVVDEMESDIVEFVYTINIESGLGDIVDDGIKVFPIPTTDYLTVETADYEKLELTLTNMSGVIVQHESHNGNHADLNLGKLPSGTYLLTISDGVARRQTVRVIRQ